MKLSWSHLSGITVLSLGTALTASAQSAPPSTSTTAAATNSSGSANPGSSRKPPAVVVQKNGMTKALTLGTTRKMPSGTDPDSANASTTGTSVLKKKASWTDNLTAIVMANVHGPAMGRISAYQTNSATGEIDRKAPLNSESTVIAGYRFSNGTSVGVTETVVYSPVDNMGALSADPFLSVGAPLLQKGSVRLMGQLREYIPLSTRSQQADINLRTRAVLVGSYSPSNSRWSVTTTTYAQHFAYGESRAQGATKMKFLLEPAVNYQIKPNLSAGVLYDMLGQNQYDSPFLKFSPADETSLSPNLSWDINQRLNVSPYLVIPTGKRVAFDTTTLNVALSMRLL